MSYAEEAIILCIKNDWFTNQTGYKSNVYGFRNVSKNIYNHSAVVSARCRDFCGVGYRNGLMGMLYCSNAQRVSEMLLLDEYRGAARQLRDKDIMFMNSRWLNKRQQVSI